MEMTARDDIGFPELTKVLMTDAALSAEVLHSANSALLGVRNEVKTIAGAVATLGIQRLSLLAVTTALWRSIPGSFNRQVVRTWWRHNLGTALFARELRKAEPKFVDHSYLSGLLHSAGQLALIGAYPADYLALLERASASGQSVSAAEVEEFGSDHCALGAALLTSWHVPPEVVDGAAHHHDPENAGFAPTVYVHTACQAANYLGYSMFGPSRQPLEDLPEPLQAIVSDEVLCTQIDEQLNSIEASLR